ncbi:hypothetical protein JYU34_011353 [Plutella xylostella]|uniref:Uncharacterized protein n=1 Tax=Plutella xylostella TaxID=51655 RepID=A0ABQ7QGT5_PLUXY|nr:hypothetical protein JYU34_011353 [Plutella xylostella]
MPSLESTYSGLSIRSVQCLVEGAGVRLQGRRGGGAGAVSVRPHYAPRNGKLPLPADTASDSPV